MENNVVYTYRYMWKCLGNDSIKFKIVTDTLEGILEFEKCLLCLENLDTCGKEYLHEYDCSKIGLFVSLKNNEEGEVKKDEKI